MRQPAIATPTATPRPARGRRWTRWLARGAGVLGGLALGLALAEGTFYCRDGGAFPHLNVYLADPELGVRLSPGATERIAFGGNPVSHVRINADGLRGADLPPPGKDEVLVVGDSQVFGLGVEEDEAFAARLAGLIGRPVVNAGVPTYGPAEYRAVIADQLARRHPRTVVLTINLVNDLFEAEHPNNQRHAVWDGWAVRKETAPAATTSFPGRDLVFRRSHLVFALRRWLHAGDPIDERGVASEGTWRDLVATGEHVRDDRRALDRARQQRLDAMTEAHRQIEGAERRIDEQIQRLLGESIADGPARVADGSARVADDADPDDIVGPRLLVESSRATIATARHIARAAVARATLRAQLARWAEVHRSADASAARANLTASDRALAVLTELDAQRIQAMLEPPLGGYLADVQQLVERAGARLVVVVLPIDVQVSPAEWAKYGATPIDMAPAAALTGELIERCHALGVSALDATAVLAAAEPGAFLDHDIHMTPNGHAAVAAALARTLAEPPPARPATARSPIPLPEVWRQAPEVAARGMREAGCEAKQIREWLRVQCARTRRARPIDVELTRDDGHEAIALVLPVELSLLVPVAAGHELAATLTWSDQTRVLHVGWPVGASQPTVAFDPPIARVAPGNPVVPTFRSATERALCNCWRVVFGAERTVERDQTLACPGAYGAPDPACVQRYDQSDATCPALLACTRRDPASPP
ncbi:MAG TPA: hypothetical protein VH165_11545 [Kofleriaceae bacterium]|jgi:hypothetical protein|nr:hypothetical protein [Kofleriaceae bacterium]